MSKKDECKHCLGDFNFCDCSTMSPLHPKYQTATKTKLNDLLKSEAGGFDHWMHQNYGKLEPDAYEKLQQSYQRIIEAVRAEYEEPKKCQHEVSFWSNNCKKCGNFIPNPHDMGMM